MVNVLIPTKPDDQHALLVKMALEQKGHQATLWYTSDFPEFQTHSFELSQDSVDWQAQGLDFVVNHNNEFDVVWLRRPRRPVLPDTIHPEDIENANHENMEFFKMLWYVIAPHAFWVNSIISAKKASCKLLQLKIANEIGFKVPQTLISNDPEKIKHFIKLHGERNTIYKTLFPVAWVEKNELRLTYTQEIALLQLPADSILQLTAGIFQKKINKSFELRVNIFGNCCITAKIKSQEHPKGLTDWRFVPAHELKIEEFVLPESIYQKCKVFMKELGIIFGCFDFIVTEEGEYYFLEVNEQGQFLWIEDVNPNIKLLDAFTDFLIAGKEDFTWHKSSDSVALSHYMEEMILAKEKAMVKHKTPASLY